MQSDYERLGGKPAITTLVTAFVDRVFGDFIIGFQFQGRDKQRIVRHEVEHACRVLGGTESYTGRPLGQTHGPLRINRGHFRRRLAILKTVLLDHDVPEDIVDRWLAHDRRLERVITDGTDCVADGVEQPHDEHA